MKFLELASYNNLLRYLKDFQRTEKKRRMMIQISSNIHPHHHLLHLYHHRRQRRRRLPRRRRPLCSYLPRSLVFDARQASSILSAISFL
jgi:hypothetical protein